MLGCFLNGCKASEGVEAFVTVSNVIIDVIQAVGCGILNSGGPCYEPDDDDIPEPSSSTSSTTTMKYQKSISGIVISGYTDLDDFRVSGEEKYSGFYISKVDNHFLLNLSCESNGIARFKLANDGRLYTDVILTLSGGWTFEDGTQSLDVSKTGEENRIVINCPDDDSTADGLMIYAKNSNQNDSDTIGVGDLVARDVYEFPHLVYDETSDQAFCSHATDLLAPYRQAQLDVESFSCKENGDSTYWFIYSNELHTASFLLYKYTDVNALQSFIYDSVSFSIPVTYYEDESGTSGGTYGAISFEDYGMYDADSKSYFASVVDSTAKTIIQAKVNFNGFVHDVYLEPTSDSKKSSQLYFDVKYNSIPDVSDNDTGRMILKIGKDNFISQGVLSGFSGFGTLRSNVFYSDKYPKTRLISHEGYHAMVDDYGDTQDLRADSLYRRLMYWGMMYKGEIVDSNSIILSPEESSHLRHGVGEYF